jgi:hypothetical protein
MNERLVIASLIVGASILVAGAMNIYFSEYQSCVRGSMAIDKKPDTAGWRAVYQRECALKTADDPLVDHTMN